MDKSLAPLIAIFALIILLSLIMLNSKVLNRGHNINSRPNASHKMEIRPDEPGKLLLAQVSQKRGGNAALINVGDSFGKAKALLAEGKTDDAEDIIRTILVFNPDHRQALSLLGGILYYSNRYKEAEAVFRHQIKLDPANSLAYDRLGSALAKQKKYKEAIDSSSIAVGMMPESGNGHINLAGMYSMVGDKKRAMEHFKKAYELIGYAILPLSYDDAFDNIRTMPEFQNLLSEAKNRKKRAGELKTANPPKKSAVKDQLFNSEQEKAAPEK